MKDWAVLAAVVGLVVGLVYSICEGNEATAAACVTGLAGVLPGFKAD